MATNEEIEDSLIRIFGFDWLSYKVWIVNRNAKQILEELDWKTLSHGELIDKIEYLKRKYKVD